MQGSLNQNELDQYLSIVKTFMLEVHQRISEEVQYPSIDPHLTSIVDQASIKLKTERQHVNILQQQLKQSQIAKIGFKDMKNQHIHLQKRLTQKGDEISILRQTVKTLYQDNERISTEKQLLSKQLNSLKETSSSLRKKLKKQEEQILNHRNQLRRLTSATEDKIGEYLKEDQHKQLTIKKLTSEIQRVKSELNKKQKSLNSANKKLDELKNVQQQNDKCLKLAENFKQQNNMLFNQLEHVKQKFLEQKAKNLKEMDTLKHEISQYKQRVQEYKLQNSNLINKIGSYQEKITNYQNEIIMRTDKLKEKTKQVKVYSQEISKLVKRVEELSQMSDEVIAENHEISTKCKQVQLQLQEVKSFQTYIAKLKGDINSKKSQELGKLIESLGKLQSHA